jgi:hypothetical protein
MLPWTGFETLNTFESRRKKTVKVRVFSGLPCKLLELFDFVKLVDFG